MRNLKNMKFEDAKDMLKFCFEESLTIPNIEDVEEWLTVFHALLKAEGWAHFTKNVTIEKARKKPASIGFSSRKAAIASAENARALREARYYKYLREIAGGCEDSAIVVVAAENKVAPLTVKEYKMLGLGDKRDLTRRETDAIYYWKFIKDGQFDSERLEKVEKHLEKIGLLTKS